MTNNEAKAKILMFVEDEPDIIELYKIAFETEGFTVEGITTGKGAMVKVEEMTAGSEDLSLVPCAIILDILLPDVSGIEIMREIRKQSKFDTIPVIMFTNYSSDEIKREIDATKNSVYLLKMNTTPSQLVAIVKGMLVGSKAKSN